jgi:MYXO-CTERM domain-containing protein
MKDVGLTAGQGESGVDCIPKALAALESGLDAGDACKGAAEDTDDAGPVDSDEDGTGDVAELRLGDPQDPNNAGGEGLCLVRYGCGAHIEPQGQPAVWGAVLAAAALAALAFVRRRAL